MDARERALRCVEDYWRRDMDDLQNVVEDHIRQAESDAAREARREAVEEAARIADALMEQAKDPRSFAMASCIASRVRSLAATKEQG